MGGEMPNEFEFIVGIVSAVLSLVVLVSGLWTFFVQVRRSLEQVEKAEERVDEAERKAEKEPGEPRPAWDVARASLDAHFRRNLLHINVIFWLSVIASVLGFAIVAIAVLQVLIGGDGDLGAIGTGVVGVFTEFIGASFLLIYRSTLAQTGSYTRTLERINAIGMALQILEKMPEGDDSQFGKNPTKSRLAEILVRESHRIDARERSTEE